MGGARCFEWRFFSPAIKAMVYFVRAFLKRYRKEVKHQRTGADQDDFVMFCSWMFHSSQWLVHTRRYGHNQYTYCSIYNANKSSLN